MACPSLRVRMLSSSWAYLWAPTRCAAINRRRDVTTRSFTLSLRVLSQSIPADIRVALRLSKEFVNKRAPSNGLSSVDFALRWP
jgi:hypothetical protein